MDQLVKTLLMGTTGVVFLSIGLWVAHSKLRFLRKAARAIGVVNQIIETQTALGHRLYGSEIAFTTLDGKTVTLKPRSFANWMEHKVGQQVTVWYDPEWPEGAIVQSAWEWIVPAILVVFGMIGVTIAVQAAVQHGFP